MNQIAKIPDIEVNVMLKIFSPEKLRIYVESENKVYQIVAKALELLQNPPYKIAILSLENKVLDQDKTFTQLGISQKSITVCLEFSFICRKIMISHHCFNTEIIQQVELWNPPEKQLHFEVLRRFGFEKQPYNVRFYLNGNLLIENIPLYKQGVHENETLHYSITTMLEVKYEQKQHVIEVDVAETIGELKNMLREQLNIDGGFILENEQIQYDKDDARYFQYGSVNDSKLSIKVIKECMKIPIMIKAKEQLKQFNIDQSTRVIDLEQSAKQLFNIDGQVQLSQNDIILDSSKSFRECNQISGSILNLVQKIEQHRTIEIFLRRRCDYNVKHIKTIDIYDDISVLDAHFGKQDLKYFYKNTLMRKDISFLDYHIENRDNIEYEEIISCVILISVTIEWQEQQQSFSFQPNKSIFDLKQLIDLDNSTKQLYLKENNKKVLDNQKIGELATKGKLLLICKEDQNQLSEIAEKESNIFLTIQIGKQKYELEIISFDMSAQEFKQEIRNKYSTQIVKEFKQDLGDIQLCYNRKYLSPDFSFLDLNLNNFEIAVIRFIRVRINFAAQKITYGKTFNINDSIGDLEKKMANGIKDDYKKIVFLYQEQIMDSNRKLYEYHIQDNDVIEMQIEF